MALDLARLHRLLLLAAFLALVALQARAAASPLSEILDRQQLGGYLQVDYLHSQLSEDQLDDATGEPLNQDRFLIRRARLNLSGDFKWAEYALQVDLNTVRGFQVGMRQLEFALKWPSRRAGAPPLIRLGAGIFRAPFGYEVYELGDNQRLFAERSLTGTAFFPGEFDVGARLSGGVEWLHAVLAVQNGEPLGSRAFPGRDPNAAKDLIGRIMLKLGLHSRVRLEAAFSAMWGRGFHPGNGPTKPSLVWRDYNEDGIVQSSELQALPSAASSPSLDFDRWGLEADLRLHLLLWRRLGETVLYGEVARGVNLDRGVRPADPIFTGRDQRELGAYAAITQELTRWGQIGFRFDYYEPALDATRVQSGRLVRSRERFFTYSIAAALRVGAERWRGRLLVDYTINRHPLGLDSAGRPAPLAADVLTLRLQGEF